MLGNRRWLFLLLGLTFLAGAAAGIWAERAFLSQAEASPGAHRRHRGHWHSRTLARFSERLQLTEEQVAQVESILKGKRQSYREAFELMRPKLQELRETTRSEIRAILQAPQIPEFERMCQEEDERHSARRRKGKDSHADRKHRGQ